MENYCRSWVPWIWHFENLLICHRVSWSMWRLCVLSRRENDDRWSYIVIADNLWKQSVDSSISVMQGACSCSWTMQSVSHMNWAQCCTVILNLVHTMTLTTNLLELVPSYTNCTMKIHIYVAYKWYILPLPKGNSQLFCIPLRLSPIKAL